MNKYLFAPRRGVHIWRIGGDIEHCSRYIMQNPKQVVHQSGVLQLSRRINLSDIHALNRLMVAINGLPIFVGHQENSGVSDYYIIKLLNNSDNNVINTLGAGTPLIKIQVTRPVFFFDINMVIVYLNEILSFPVAIRKMSPVAIYQGHL